MKVVPFVEERAEELLALAACLEEHFPHSNFVFEDEGCLVPEDLQTRFEQLPEEYSHLYLAVEGRLAAVLCIEDSLREEAPEVVAELKKAGFTKIVMMTGDSRRPACAIAARAGIDEYYAEVLPENKAAFVLKEKTEGRRVVMVGDGAFGRGCRDCHQRRRPAREGDCGYYHRRGSALGACNIEGDQCGACQTYSEKLY